MESQIGEESEVAVDFNALPEGCISDILSLTTPADASRLASVSPIFRFAADSDAVWDRFLLPDHREIISRSATALPPPASLRKKDFYLSLCNNPILIDNGTKSFWLDKWTGKNCFMLAARDLGIAWGDTPQYWTWTSLPNESRFAEVAELNYVFWLEIRGRIHSSMLSPSTNYAAYLVFRITTTATGFDRCRVEVSVGKSIGGGSSHKQLVCLDPKPVAGQSRLRRPKPVAEQSRLRRPKERRDGWLEIELGEFFNQGREGEENGELTMSVLEIKELGHKSGLIVEGIEVRPKPKQDTPGSE